MTSLPALHAILECTGQETVACHLPNWQHLWDSSSGLAAIASASFPSCPPQFSRADSCLGKNCPMSARLDLVALLRKPSRFLSALSDSSMRSPYCSSGQSWLVFGLRQRKRPGPIVTLLLHVSLTEVCGVGPKSGLEMTAGTTAGERSRRSSEAG